MTRRRAPVHYRAGEADPFAPVTAFCGAEVWLKDTTPKTSAATCPECRQVLAAADVTLSLLPEGAP